MSYATNRRSGMEARAAADAINDFGRDPIGEGSDERAYNRELKTLLDNHADNAEVGPEIGEREASSQAVGSGGRKRVRLEDLTRFTMVKRIW